MIHSEDKSERLKGSQIVRKLLSREVKPPIDEVINASLVPVFTQFIRGESNHFQDSYDNNIIFESLWILTNVASGNTAQTQTVIDANAIELAIKLIDSSDTNIREQAIWLLGNIAGDSPKTRDLVLDSGILQPLLEYTHTQKFFFFIFLKSINFFS